MQSRVLGVLQVIEKLSFFTKFNVNLSAKFQLQIIFTSAVELNLFHFLTSCLYSVYVITLLEIAMVIYSAENISHVFIYLYNVIILNGGHHMITARDNTK